MSARLTGKIVGYSPQGSLITDITREQLAGAPRDERFCIRCDEHETNCLFDVDHQQPPSTLIAVINTEGRLELEIVGDSAKIMLGVPLGEPVEVVW